MMFFNHKYPIFFTITLAAIVLMSVSACTTQKKRGEVSKLSVAYHDVTSKYNGYFNADVLYNESLTTLQESYLNNYNKLIPVFPELAVENANSVSADLDLAIEKVSVTISLHRVSHWTDDCYLLLGKSQYLKKDYESAEATLRYLEAEFSPKAMAKKEDKRKKKGKSASAKARANAKKSKKQKNKEVKKRKKKREKERKEHQKQVKAARKKGGKAPPRPSSKTAEEKKKEADKKVAENEKKADPKKYEDEEGGLFKRTPAFYEGRLWLAKTRIERSYFSDAQGILFQLKNDSRVTSNDDLQAELLATEAYLAIRQEKYQEAVQPLEQSIKLLKDKAKKARYYFIIAQIYQNQGMDNESLFYYEEVIRMRPKYEMEFAARKNVALNEWLAGRSTPDQAISNINKLLKDDKNTDFKDQLYFTLAKIFLEQKDDRKAIEYFEKSLASNSTNKNQRVESTYELAHLYLGKEDFVNAKAYYDSTLTVLPQTDERYAEVSRYATNLSGISKNIQIIRLQDSLLSIASMSDEDKRSLAAKIIEEKQNQQLINLQNQIPTNTSRSNTPSATSLSSSFFAYNPDAVKKGKRNFERVWGDRPLSDYWRLTSRQKLILGDDLDPDTIVTDIVTDQEIENVFKDVPTTEGELSQAYHKIYDATFELGRQYRDQLQNYAKSAEALEDMYQRFPDSTRHELNGWYYAYLDYSDMNNASKADEYYQKIIKKYSNTTYARVLTDPNYLESLEGETKQLGKMYEEAFNDFKSHNYTSANKKITALSNKVGTSHDLSPRVTLLEAMVSGNTEGREAYIAKLKNVATTYPKTPEAGRAREILRVLGEDGGGTPDDGLTKDRNKDEKDDIQYTIKDKEVHYFIIRLRTNDELEDAKNFFADFNSQYFRNDNLRVSNVVLKDYPILVIRKFSNKDDAMRYYSMIKTNAKDFLRDFQPEFYPVNRTNYITVVRERSLDGYDSFFKKNYF